MIYRLYTEDKNRKWICQLVSEHFAGFNVSEQTGYWQGKVEKSLCIEIIDSSNSAALKITRICKAICGYNKQQCTLVVKIQPQNIQFIGSSGIR